ncbi:MAG: heparinase II/III-family protein [Eggerthellaceae bacterium]|nr:heparinase II/III-family protein [Eggerthellaceae bacterium]
MRDSVHQGEINLRYILRKATVASDVLVVAFPGAGGWHENALPHLGYSYLNAVASFNVNGLFLKGGTEEEASSLGRMVCVSRDFKVERTVIELINKAKEETGSTRVIAIGSSMGGWCSAYYGLKYDYDVISGSPAYAFKTKEGVKFTAGGTSKEDYEFCNSLLSDVIKKAGIDGYNKHFFISWGEGEGNWVRKEHGPQFLAALNDAKIPYTHKLFNFSSHWAIHWLFPDILKQQLSSALGLPISKDQEELTDLQRVDREIQNMKKAIEAEINTLDETTPNYCSANIEGYGSNNRDTQLRTFVYGAQGYHWWQRGGRDKANYLGPLDIFWGAAIAANGDYAASFLFQRTLLSFYKNEGNQDAWGLLDKSTRQFFYQIDTVAKVAKTYNTWWTAVRRMHFFLDWANVLGGKNVPDGVTGQVVNTLSILLGTQLPISTGSLEQYRVLLALLHATQYFKNSTNFFDKTYEAELDGFAALNNYYFDKNGVCIYQQSRTQHVLRTQINEFIEFMTANEFPENPKIKKIKRHAEKIESVTKHLIRPNGQIPNLGHTAGGNAELERLGGNLILPTSNFTILDEDGTYITINSGNPCHSAFKHCDLLSFTFFYDGHLLVAEAGGGAGNLADYSRSALAHSALICDDGDYVIPEYNDFTTIDAASEHTDYVLIGMSHRLYPDVELRRAFLWLKPNIIVLLDSAKSETEHVYGQNFLLEKDAQEFLSITQHGDSSELEKFTGTTDISDYDNLRGSVISNFKKPLQAMNLTYTQKGTSANYVTVLEAHTGKEGEISIKSVQVDAGNIKIMPVKGRAKVIPLEVESGQLI